MTRRGWFFATYFAVLGVAASWAFHPTPRWVWNETASVPVGLYRIQPTTPVRVGDIVALRLPEREATLLASRGYLPFGVPLLKPVAALAAQSVCRIGIHVTIDGKSVGDAKTVDHRGRKLPVWQGCQRLEPLRRACRREVRHRPTEGIGSDPVRRENPGKPTENGGLDKRPHIAARLRWRFSGVFEVLSRGAWISRTSRRGIISLIRRDISRGVGLSP